MDGSIFISYRRDTESAFAGRLYDRLEHSFGRERVFIDVYSIVPGEDFVAVLQSPVAECDVLLALIGRGWLTATDASGQRRLDNPDDFVRIEITAALAQGKRVIPVLGDNVSMPRKEELPEEIRPLARRQAIRLTHDRFKDDAERLIRALEKALAEAEAARQAEEDARIKEEEEKRQRAERERQRTEVEAKRQAEEKDWRWTEEAKRRDIGEKPRPVALGWIIGGAIVLAVILGAIFVWPSPEQAPVPSVTAEQKAVRPSPPVDAEKAPEEKALAPRTFRECDVCPEMVALPGGTFLMGSPENEEGRSDDEGPQHEVTIRPFAIGKYEVRFDDWDACVAAGGCNGYQPDDEGWGRGR